MFVKCRRMQNLTKYEKSGKGKSEESLQFHVVCCYISSVYVDDDIFRNEMMNGVVRGGFI